MPASGGAIIASNHLSVMDSIFLPLMLDRSMTFVAKSEYFKSSKPIGRLTGRFLRGSGMLEVDRASAKTAQAALDASLAVLRDGELFGIYPEGTRSPDGRLYRGRTGVARLAVAAGVPIIPVGMLGTDKVQPIGHRLPKLGRGKVTVKFGKPIETTGRADDRTSLRALTDEVMAEIQKLTGQEYVPRYAPPRNAPPSSPSSPASPEDEA